jgi:hypothetical protein
VNGDTGLPNGVPFIAMFNPDQIGLEETLVWQENTAPGHESSDYTYIKTHGRTFSINILLDGTGVNTNGVKIPVPAQILLFRAATSKINGTEHKPNLLLLQYGTFVINCVLKSSTVTYTAFDMFGVPIRAKIQATFAERVAGGLSNALSMISSPDLTHQVEVKEYDLLPLLTYKVYNDQSYYIQVARVNRLKNFRKLEAGTTLIFPPVSDKS